MSSKLTSALAVFLAIPAIAPAQQPKPQTVAAFDCYVQSAEERMNARKSFLLADADPSLNAQLVRGRKVVTVAPNGDNPHKIPGGQVYDWIGSVFIPGATLARTLGMLKDYDHRAQYFPETISSSKLLCRAGDNHFVYTMRMKEPEVIDVESDVVWEPVDAHRSRCRSYSISVKEIGKQHGYVQRIYTYWRFAEAGNGVYVEGEAIELSGEFGSLMRAIGSMMGINPEKSLRHSLEAMRESLSKPGLEFSAPPAGLPECGQPFRPAVCAASVQR